MQKLIKNKITNNALVRLTHYFFNVKLIDVGACNNFLRSRKCFGNVNNLLGKCQTSEYGCLNNKNCFGKG